MPRLTRSIPTDLLPSEALSTPEVVLTDPGLFESGPSTASSPSEDRAEALVAATLPTVEQTLAPWMSRKNIRDEQLYKQALETGKVVKGLLNKSVAEEKEILEPFQEGIARLKAKFARIINPLKEGERKLKALAIEFDGYQRQKTLEDAEKKAEKLRAKGLDEQADDVLTTALVADVTPQVDGASFRINWKAKVVNERAVIEAVLANRLPMNVLEIKSAPLNALARATKQEQIVDGVKFYYEKTAALKGS